MNTILAGNSDLEIWEGQVGETHSIAATWLRKDQQAQCGFQIFLGWNGFFTLMVLEHSVWITPIHKSTDLQAVRKVMFRYMSEHIEELNKAQAFTTHAEFSFRQAHTTLNDWLHDQSKLIEWVQQFR